MQPVSVQESLLVAFSPKLEYLATGSRDGRLKAFDTGNFAVKLLGAEHRDGLDTPVFFIWREFVVPLVQPSDIYLPPFGG